MGHTYIKLVIFVVILLTVILFLTNNNSYSVYSVSTGKDFQINSASGKDLIEYIYINSENPDKMIIKKSKNAKYDPIIYFSIDGDAANYILHINPAKLNSFDKYSIPIKMTITQKQAEEYFESNNAIKGTITVKYLNEYINEKIEINYSKEYILNLFTNIENNENNENLSGESYIEKTDIIEQTQQNSEENNEQEQGS